MQHNNRKGNAFYNRTRRFSNLHSGSPNNTTFSHNNATNFSNNKGNFFQENLCSNQYNSNQNYVNNNNNNLPMPNRGNYNNFQNISQYGQNSSGSSRNRRTSGYFGSENRGNKAASSQQTANSSTRMDVDNSEVSNFQLLAGDLYPA